VELEEGWHIISNLIGCEDDAVQVGMPVQVEFVAIDEGKLNCVLPYFRPR
jgi:uncharacterized OB-fold protein